MTKHDFFMMALGLFIRLTTLATVAATPSCPPDFSLVHSSPNLTVCESLGVRAGSLRFFDPRTGLSLASVSKTAEPLFVNESGCYLGYNKTQVERAHGDLLGDALLNRSNGSDPDYLELAGAIPPLVYDGA